MASAATTFTGWKTLACAAACLTATAAQAATPMVACKPRLFDGVPVCAVNMTDYATFPGSGRQVCANDITSTGPSKICEQSLAAAMSDARLFFKAPANAATPYLVFIDAGLYDFSAQSRPLPHLGGAIDPSGIVPGGTGCLQPGAPSTGIVKLSGSGCLIISGAGPDSTELLSRDGIPGISGTNVSHLLVENLTMAQTNKSATQASFAAQGSTVIEGYQYPTLTIDVPAGMPSPLDLYLLNCAQVRPGGCSRDNFGAVVNDLYMRAYSSADMPQTILSASQADNNSQNAWGYPSVAGTKIAAVPPVQPDPANYPNRWTLTMSTRTNLRALPSSYSGTTNGAQNLICMKLDHAQAFFFEDLVHGGTDIIMNHMAWIGAGRGVFRGISASSTSAGAQVYNSRVDRAPGQGGVMPCLSTQSGGLQIGQPGDPAIYGAAVYNFAAQATADDSIAVFNDIGGTPAPGGGVYPQSTILHSRIGNSFGHNIVLHNSPAHSGLPGPSPVLVDQPTRDFVTQYGHCDPIVVGQGNCPVTYITD